MTEKEKADELLPKSNPVAGNASEERIDGCSRPHGHRSVAIKIERSIVGVHYVGASLARQLHRSSFPPIRGFHLSRSSAS